MSKLLAKLATKEAKDCWLWWYKPVTPKCLK
jgi:cyclic lactone autoinducer peptide